MVYSQALHQVYSEPHKYRPFLRALAGVVLLGTPHSDQPERWIHFANILLTGKGNLRKNLITNEEAKMLALNSAHFSKAQVDVPVISFFETHATTVRRAGLFNSSQKVKVRRVTV